MSLMRRARSLVTQHTVGAMHISNSSHVTHGTKMPKLPHPMKSGYKVAKAVQTPHTPSPRHDSNPYGLHAAQLANARTAVASSKPARYGFARNKVVKPW